jgi:hypothetical protein
MATAFPLQGKCPLPRKQRCAPRCHRHVRATPKRPGRGGPARRGQFGSRRRVRRSDRPAGTIGGSERAEVRHASDTPTRSCTEMRWAFLPSRPRAGAPASPYGPGEVRPNRRRQPRTLSHRHGIAVPAGNPFLIRGHHFPCGPARTAVTAPHAVRLATRPRFLLKDSRGTATMTPAPPPSGFPRGYLLP